MARRKIASAPRAGELRRSVNLVLMEMKAFLAQHPQPDLMFECVGMYDAISRWRADLVKACEREGAAVKSCPLAADGN